MAKSKLSKLSKGWITLIIVGVLVLFFILWVIGTYNSLITLDMNANNAWAQVETQYQRRVDLIPNLVETVKGYAKQEQTLFTKITELRSQWASAKTVDQKITTANELDTAFARLMVVVENYPELKSSANFLALQDELAGTENRIAVERKRFNDAIAKYNIKVRRFPSKIIAGIFGFEQRMFFEAQEGAETPPKVTF